MTEQQNPKTTINFFDGTNLVLDMKDAGLDFITDEIVRQKKVKHSTIQIFVLGEEEPIDEYNEEPTLFCLFKEAVEIQIKNTYEQNNEQREDHYQQVGLFITELIEDRYEDMENGDVNYDIDDVREWVENELADERFNSKGCDKIFNNDNDVFGSNASPYIVMFEFDEIKNYIEEELEYEDKITHSNYMRLYEYALAREWCVNVEISTTQEDKEAYDKLKSDITNIVLKQMYWDVDKIANERLEITRETFNYIVLEIYAEVFDDKDNEEIREYIGKMFENNNVILGYYRLLADIKIAKEMINEIFVENDEFKQDLYDKYIF